MNRAPARIAVANLPGAALLRGGRSQRKPVNIQPTAPGGGISKVVNGNRVVVTDQFPSSQTQPGLGSLVSGVSDIAFIGSTLYAITAGSGCSHGVPDTVNGVFRVSSNGHISMVANLSAFQVAHPVANREPDDFEPDGTWYSMIAVRGDLYAIEPNHGELDKITTSGQISRVVDISASQGHIVPTAVDYHGNFLRRELEPFPDRVRLVEGPQDQPERLHRARGLRADDGYRPRVR